MAESNLNCGVKYDSGKNRLDLLPFDALLEVGKVLTYGATKYAPRNWEKGIDYSRLYAAALRHEIKFWEGQTFDEETNIHALAHAACDVLFLLSFELRNMKKFDDRPINNNDGGSEIDNSEKCDTIQSTNTENHENYISDLQKEKIIGTFVEFINLIDSRDILNFINNYKRFDIEMLDDAVEYEMIVKSFISNLSWGKDRYALFCLDRLADPKYGEFILHSKKCCEIFKIKIQPYLNTASYCPIEKVKFKYD